MLECIILYTSRKRKEEYYAKTNIIVKVIYLHRTKPKLYLSIQHGLGLDGPGGAGDFSLLRSFQVVSDVHPVSYPLGIGGCLPQGKAASE
jgi:hypothetical protein